MLTKVQLSFSSLPLPLPPLPACRGCGHERIRAISRAPDASGHAWTEPYLELRMQLGTPGPEQEKVPDRMSDGMPERMSE